jgi:MFS family permease
MVTVPLYLSEIAPKRFRTTFGVLHQIWIGVGMITAQSLSIPFAGEWNWRWSLFVGMAIAAVLLVASTAMREYEEGGKDEDRPAEVESGGDEQTPLINRGKPAV